MNSVYNYPFCVSICGVGIFTVDCGGLWRIVPECSGLGRDHSVNYNLCISCGLGKDRSGYILCMSLGLGLRLRAYAYTHRSIRLVRFPSESGIVPLNWLL